jgi:hypothetical protein
VYITSIGRYGIRPHERDNKTLYWFVRRQEKLYNDKINSSTGTNNNTNNTTKNRNCKSSSPGTSLTPKRIALLRELGFLLHT